MAIKASHGLLPDINKPELVGQILWSELRPFIEFTAPQAGIRKDYGTCEDVSLVVKGKTKAEVHDRRVL